MKNNFLLAISIILAVVFLFTGCQKTTQEDIDKQGTRWLIILYKMTDGANNEQAFELISQVEETLKQEFENDEKIYTEIADAGSIKDKYEILLKQNKLMEDALARLKGKKALGEIDGKYSLEEILDLIE